MLVGRQREQRILDALISAARVGQSSTLVITGEAGIGKTALLRYTAESATGMQVLHVTGSETEQHLPFAALAQLVRPTPRDLETLPPPQAQALGVALAIRSGEAVDRFAVGAAAHTLLTQRSENRPMAVLIDDAQLVDVPSQETLAFVARRLLADAILIVAAVRTGEPCALCSPDLPTWELRGIDADASRELVAARRAEPTGADLAARVHELSGGNPLAILELAADPTGLTARWPGAPAPVPATLVRLYAQRAAALGEPARGALLLAAAAGDDLPLVARACAADGIDVGSLAEAERIELIRILDDRVTFAHPLARAAIYSTATPGRRRTLHATIAAVLGDADPDRRAWHRAEACLGPDEAVAGELQALGARSADRGALAVAATGFEHAARLSPEDTDRARRLLLAGEAACRAGDAARATSLLDQSLLLMPPPSVRARAQRMRGVIALRSGSIADARAALTAAAVESTAFDATEALACWAEAIHACFYLADADAALAAAEEAETLLARDVSERSAVLATIAAGMARVLAGAGGGTEMIRRGVGGLMRLEPIAPHPGDEASWLLLGPLFLRDSSTGRDLVRRALDERRDRAAIGTLAHLLFHLARDGATTDRWTAAEGDYTEAISLAREFGQTTELAASSAGLAWLLARQGRGDDTRRYAAEAEQLGATHQINLARIWSRHALGDLELGRGQVDAAVATFTELHGLLRRLGVKDVDLSPVPELVECLIRTGRIEEARDLAGSYQSQALAKGQPWALARAARVRALLCPVAEVDHCFSAALDLHAATLDCFEHARTRLAYGARLRRLRRRVDARPFLQSAYDDFTRLGARPWADEAASELAATGATVLRPGAGPAGLLTPRELQIALHLAGGRTTRETAAALFLSPKTVEYHLRHVYTKLGIDSRPQLVARMQPTPVPSTRV
jgi:DNA-binding CsgD family transcriptional regulator/tetratricopeptide (TPR) repeat protein